jgi:hypothetical protein
MKIPPDDVLYDLPSPDELSDLDQETVRRLADEHLQKVRATHGNRCPNCGRKLDNPALVYHVALDRGVCASGEDERQRRRFADGLSRGLPEGDL